MGNAIYRKVNGGIVQDYQEWTNYPDSPVLTSSYPYQYVYSDAAESNHSYLLVSAGILWCDVTNFRRVDSGSFVRYFLSGGAWITPYTVTNSFTADSPFNEEANNDIFTSIAMTSIYFAKTTIDPVASQTIRVRNLRHKTSILIDETSVSSEVRARGVWWKSGGGGILEPSIQEWTGYPSSPDISAISPYQLISTAGAYIPADDYHYEFDVGTYLFVSQCKWEHSGDFLGTDIATYNATPLCYKLVDNAWTPSTIISAGYIIDITLMDVLFTNRDIVEGDN